MLANSCHRAGLVLVPTSFRCAALLAEQFSTSAGAVLKQREPNSQADCCYVVTAVGN